MSFGMYHDYFGFDQAPFSIAPDPDFLYLGPRHREGLEHLRNGLLGSGGFLLLTGEVGTGKTTLSRAVFDEFEAQFQVAFVLNPMLSERELLATLCDQFGIPGRHEKASLKRLTDHLSRFLQEASALGRHPVVLIDEAQHLLPSVLEQLRLLTNLETNSRKLLSVVLIGQPELQDLLQRRELRQVAQRIVARYHLLPLTELETKAYIDHRLQRVGGRTDVFESAALSRIYQFSQGTPRLINLVCDRALQIAAQQAKRTVNKAIVRAAVESLSFVSASSAENFSIRLLGPRMAWIFSGFLVVCTLAFLAWNVWNIKTVHDESVAHLHENQVQQPMLGIPAGSSSFTNEPLLGVPANIMLTLLTDRWQVSGYTSGSRACEDLAALNLGCLFIDLTLDQLVQLDLPALLEIDGKEGWLLLNAWRSHSEGGQAFHVIDGQGSHLVSAQHLQQHWHGRVFLLWQLPDSENFRQWVREGVQAYLPYSLRSAPLEQQVNWLRSSLGRTVTARMHEGDEGYLTDVELAYLSAGFYSTRPSLLRPMAPTIARLPSATDFAIEDLAIPLMRKDVFSTQRIDAMMVSPADDSARNPSSSPASDTSLNEEEVPEHIRNLFENAVAAIGIDDVLRPAQQNMMVQTLPFARDLPVDQLRQLPRFSYDSHMYSDSARDRWIRINDRMLREGERFGELRVIAIEPSHTVFGFQDILFRLEALEDLSD